MQKNQDIRMEMQEISPLLANLADGMPYLAPPGYFESFADQVMLRLHVSVLSPDPEVTYSSRLLPFAVPAGYFEGFAAGIMDKIKSLENVSVQDELASISPLLSGISRKPPFAVPDGYFDGLAAGLKTAASENELEQSSYPAFAGLNHKQTYGVPNGYFDGLPDVLMARIAQTASPQAKVIPFKKKSNWLKYAAAAVVIGILAASGILFYANRPTAGNDALASLAKVSDQEVISYLEDQSTPLVAEASPGVASSDISEADAKDLLSDVPDEELQQYVDEHVNAKDLITN